LISKQKIKIIGIRPPVVDIILKNYPNTRKEISVIPQRARVPSLGLFYVGTIFEKELKELGYDVNLVFYDMSASDPDNVYPYSGKVKKYSAVSYGKGKIIKRLRGESLEKLYEISKDADVCYISSLFATDSNAVIQVFETIKKINPKVFCLVGGRDAQFRPDFYLDNCADVVFLGQAENLAGRVVDFLIRKKPIDFYGVATKNNKGSLGKKIKIDKNKLKKKGISCISNFVNEISRNSLLEQNIFPNFDKKILSMYTDGCDGKLPKNITGPLMWYRTSVGCPGGCDFCPSAMSPYMYMSPEKVKKMLMHYKKAGIKTLISAEDNFLARFFDKNKTEKEIELEIIQIMKTIRELGFANEFSNGLQVSLLVDKNKKIRSNLINAIFKCEKAKNGKIVGTYRVYWPIEDLVNRKHFAKLSDKRTHYKIIDAVLKTGIPEIVFNTILFSDFSKEDIKNLKKELDYFCCWMKKHQRNTSWTIAIFHELPLPGAKNYNKLLSKSFDIDKHSELWAVPINPTNGKYYNYHELYSVKRKLMDQYDPEGLESWDNQGRYGPTHHKNDN